MLSPVGPPMEHTESATPGTSWGDEMDIVLPLVDDAEVSCEAMFDSLEANDELLSESSEGASEHLVSDEDDDVFFAPSGRNSATQGADCDNPGTQSRGMELFDVAKRAAEKLAIPWPAVTTETSTSRYEGKRLPVAKRTTKQVLPLFPECVDEVTRCWAKPFSSPNPVQGAAAFDCAGMKEKGIYQIPTVENLVASHLHPNQKLSMSSGPSLPSKAERLQSSLADKAYKSVATTARALNASSLLLAYSAELQDQAAANPDASELWEELGVVTDQCLHLTRAAVQAAGRALSIIVLQERARWLNLSGLSDREKRDILDESIDPAGLFGTAVATMQRRCEEKKKEGEALQLCLPRKTQAAPPPSRRTFAQVTSRPAGVPTFKIPRRPAPQVAAQGPLGSQNPKTHWPRKHVPPAAAQGAPPPAKQSDRKKKRTA